MSYKAVSNMVGGYKCHDLSQKVSGHAISDKL